MRTTNRQNGIHAAKPQIRAAARAATKCWGTDYRIYRIEADFSCASTAKWYHTPAVVLAAKLLSALPRRCVICTASKRDFNKYVKSEETTSWDVYWERKYNGRGPLAGEWVQ